MEEDDSTLKKLSSLLFGGSCFLCRGASRGLLCPACDADLPRLETRLCPRCALRSPGGAVCGRCLAQPPRYDATVAALAYAFPADVLIQALKFRGELALAPLLAAMLAERIPAGEKVDLVLPVPLAPARLRERGYNQSAEIARRLHGRAPLELFLCERSRDTAAQAGLPWPERRRNVRGAFRCARAIRGGTVAVVDDVMTTGATLDEMAATLKQAGAARVVNWVVARTYVDDAAPEPRPGELMVFDIVLVHPEIPPNAGNVIRLAANTGCRLHLVEPLGFSLDDKQLRRAGLDYHQMAHVSVHRNWGDCRAALAAQRLFALSTRGMRSYAEVSFQPGDGFVFGAETSGLAASVLLEFAEERRLRLPMRPGNRSLNLSNAVAVVVFEAWRQLGFEGSG